MNRHWLKILSVLLTLVLLLPCAAPAESWLPGAAPVSVDANLDSTVIEGAEAAGDVYEVHNGQRELADREQTTASQDAQFAMTPLDVVLVIDSSGSMSATDSVNGKQALTYAQDAAIAFSRTLFSVNPGSRVSMVDFSSDASVSIGFTGLSDENALYSAVRRPTANGQTNTGKAYETALSQLGTARANARRVVLLLSDGQPQDLDYAVSQGRRVAGESTLYTVGLVGNLSANELEYTRRCLNTNYVRRYYELPFTHLDDIDTKLASTFLEIVMEESMPDDTENGRFYEMLLVGALDVYIVDAAGRVMTSLSGKDAEYTPFGSITRMGSELEKLMVMLMDGTYSIRVRNPGRQSGTYSLLAFTGGCGSGRLAGGTVIASEEDILCISLEDGRAKVETQHYYPLDLNATDPFTGERTRGSARAVSLRLKKAATVYPAPDRKTSKFDSLKKGARVNILCRDPETGWFFIGWQDAASNAYARGWVDAKTFDTDDPVSTLQWPEPVEAELARSAEALRAPRENALSAKMNLPAGTKAVIRYAERDPAGREWFYISLPGREKSGYVYVPASCFDEPENVCPDPFAIAYSVPVELWTRELGGGGLTTLMWASGDEAGGQVAISGRSKGKAKAPFTPKYGDADALALLVDTDGNVTAARTDGGTGYDSYHCIVPDGAGGFFVAGVTRSNNGSFTDIWDSATYSGSLKEETGKTNALIGHLRPDLSIDWMRSFGVGTLTYGFDMLLVLPSGNILGVGWMSGGSGFALRGNGQQDYFAVELEPDTGYLVRMVNYGSGANDIHDGSSLMAGGGVMMAGSKKLGSDSYLGQVMLLDSSLKLTGTVTYGGNGKDIFDNVRALSDGTFIVTGFSNSASGTGVSKGGADYWVMNIDDQGRSIWHKRFGGGKEEELCGTLVLPDDRVVLVGKSYSANGDISYRGADTKKGDAWACCIDSKGTLLWDYTYSTPNADAFNAAAIDPSDGNLVLVGICDAKGSKTGKGLVVKLELPAY